MFRPGDIATDIFDNGTARNIPYLTGEDKANKLGTRSRKFL